MRLSGKAKHRRSTILPNLFGNYNHFESLCSGFVCKGGSKTCEKCHACRYRTIVTIARLNATEYPDVKEG